MKTIAMIAVTCLTIGALGCQKSSQAKKVKVDAQTIAALPSGSMYTVDLSHDGTIYDFDPAAGPIDFKRVVVRTRAGEKPIEQWMGKASSRTALSGWDTNGLRVGSTDDFRKEGEPPITPPPGGPTAFECDRDYCICRSGADCEDLIHTNLCQGSFFACSRVLVKCMCSRRD
jgi:hypothetical protein